MKLSVSNFQIHKTHEVDIPLGRTTYLEGDSDTGKSAMIRAIRWVCENKPDGGSFVTFGQPRGAKSTVTFDDGEHVITRERGKSENSYNMDGVEFKAFGRDVPEPIKAVLNISPYAFQCQGEPPFLIGASAPEAAKILSEACGLGVIDTAVQFVRDKKTIVGADIRKHEILIESADSRLAAATGQLPIADQLDITATLGEEELVLANQTASLTEAIEDEPTGVFIDLAQLQESFTTASMLHREIDTGLAHKMELTVVLQAEPTGVLYEIAPASQALTVAQSIAEEMEIISEQITVLHNVILDEPRGAPIDVSDIVSTLAMVNVLHGEVVVLRERCEEIFETTQAAPVASQIDVDLLRGQAAKTKRAYEEMNLLWKMCNELKNGLLEEPKGGLIDTTELLAQRAAIKVCPTCGREL